MYEVNVKFTITYVGYFDTIVSISLTFAKKYPCYKEEVYIYIIIRLTMLHSGITRQHNKASQEVKYKRELNCTLI